MHQTPIFTHYQRMKIAIFSWIEHYRSASQQPETRLEPLLKQEFVRSAIVVGQADDKFFQLYRIGIDIYTNVPILL